MADPYVVLQTHGTVKKFRAEQLERSRTRWSRRREAPDVVIFVLGRLKPGEEGRQMVWAIGLLESHDKKQKGGPLARGADGFLTFSTTTVARALRARRLRRSHDHRRAPAGHHVSMAGSCSTR